MKVGDLVRVNDLAPTLGVVVVAGNEKWVNVKWLPLTPLCIRIRSIWDIHRLEVINASR